MSKKERLRLRKTATDKVFFTYILLSHWLVKLEKLKCLSQEMISCYTPAACEKSNDYVMIQPVPILVPIRYSSPIHQRKYILLKFPVLKNSINKCSMGMCLAYW